MPLLAAFWDLLTAAGGSLALTFIVALALGINALMDDYRRMTSLRCENRFSGVKSDLVTF